MGKTLLHKAWDQHTVRQLPSGQTQLFIGLHLVHEVTSPQAFQMLIPRVGKISKRNAPVSTRITSTPSASPPRSVRLRTEQPRAAAPKSLKSTARSSRCVPLASSAVPRLYFDFQNGG